MNAFHIRSPMNGIFIALNVRNAASRSQWLPLQKFSARTFPSPSNGRNTRMSFTKMTKLQIISSNVSCDCQKLISHPVRFKLMVEQHDMTDFEFISNNVKDTACLIHAFQSAQKNTED